MSSVQAVLDAGADEVGRLLERLEVRLADAGTGHGATLARHAGDTISAGGKRLRPLLVFLCAGVPPPETEGLVRAAVAVELVHSASLVHDDVLDGAPLRRGRPSVVAAGGRRHATATGDLLFARAFAELAGGGSAEAVRVLSHASSSLARGELLQRADAWRADVELSRYLERCRLKTGVLFRAACELGAIESGHDVEALGLFGERIGVAFQLLDDILDVTGPEARTGKPRGTDLLDGTVNLPLILARELDPSLAQLELRAVVAPEDALSVCERIEASGALPLARARALDLVADAKRGLPPLPEVQLDVLHHIADGVVERYS